MNTSGAEKEADVYRGVCEVFRLRTSRKHRRCDYSRDTSWYHVCTPISPGQQYIHVTAYPGHDVVETDRPQSGACCLNCASGYTGMDTLCPLPPEVGDDA